MMGDCLDGVGVWRAAGKPGRDALLARLPVDGGRGKRHRQWGGAIDTRLGAINVPLVRCDRRANGAGQ